MISKIVFYLTLYNYNESLSKPTNQFLYKQFLRATPSIFHKLNMITPSKHIY